MNRREVGPNLACQYLRTDERTFFKMRTMSPPAVSQSVTITKSECLLCGSTAFRHPSELDAVQGRRYVRLHCGRCGSYHVDAEITPSSLNDMNRDLITDRIAKLAGSGEEVVVTLKGRREVTLSCVRVGQGDVIQGASGGV